MSDEAVQQAAREIGVRLNALLEREDIEARPPAENPMIDDEEIEVLTEKHVCVFWSHRDSDRTSVAASVENDFDKTSSKYDSCSSPDMEADAALPMCNYEIMGREDTETFCPFYKAEEDHKLLETENGEVRTTRILDFDEMTMTRTFIAVTKDGNRTEFDDPVLAFKEIQ